MPSRTMKRTKSKTSYRPISTIEKAIVTLLAVQNLQGQDPKYEANLNLGELGTFKEGESEHMSRIIQELAEKYDRSYSENIVQTYAPNRPPSRLQKTLRRFRKIAARMTGMRGTFSGRGNVPALNQ